jgi:hypothetical protein
VIDAAVIDTMKVLAGMPAPVTRSPTAQPRFSGFCDRLSISGAGVGVAGDRAVE